MCRIHTQRYGERDVITWVPLEDMREMGLSFYTNLKLRRHVVFAGCGRDCDCPVLFAISRVGVDRYDMIRIRTGKVEDFINRSINPRVLPRFIWHSQCFLFVPAGVHHVLCIRVFAAPRVYFHIHRLCITRDGRIGYGCTPPRVVTGPLIAYVNFRYPQGGDMIHHPRDAFVQLGRSCIWDVAHARRVIRLSSTPGQLATTVIADPTSQALLRLNRIYHSRASTLQKSSQLQ